VGDTPRVKIAHALALLLGLAAACARPRAPNDELSTPQAPLREAAAPATPSLPTPIRERRPPSGHRVIVRPARILDVRTGRMLEGQVIAVQDDKIVKVAPAGQIAPGPGTDVVDLPDQTVLPGLIDLHVHLTFDPKDLGWEGLGVSVPREALKGAKNARATLAAGFTTVRNLGATGYADIALRDAINDGELDGPRIVASGMPLGITGGHCDESRLPPEWHWTGPDGIADGVPAVQKKVREQIKFGADVIKVCATGGVMSHGDDPQASQYSLEELKALVADAHRLGRRVAAHAHGAEGIRFAAEAGVDTIEHATYIDDAAIAAMKARGTWLVATASTDQIDPSAMHVTPDVAEKIQKLVATGQAARARAFKAGVRFAFGTDAGVGPHGDNAKEFASLVKMGLTPLQAIQTATTHAADALGWGALTGAIEPAKWADLIAVKGDPTKDVTVLEHVTWVMRGGEIFQPGVPRETAPVRSEGINLKKDQPPLHIDSDPVHIDSNPGDRM
jgi:imidazolonepropionase-like amidohydrolase